MNNYWKDRKILITGGAGFIGSNAVDFFLKKGAIISATISPHTDTKTIKKKLGNNANKINLVRIDLLEKKTVNNLIEGIDTIMHFAAIDGGIQFKVDNSVDIYQKNFSITKILLDAAIKKNAKKILLISSSDIYPLDGINELSENDVNSSEWNTQKDGYKLAKWQSEQYALEVSKKFGLHITIVRPANIYGPRDNFEDESKMRFIPAMIRNIHLGKPVTIFGDGSDIRSFLYVENFLDISSKLMENGIFNIPVNVASKTPITLKNLAEKIIALSKKNVQVVTNNKKNTKSQKRMIDISLLEEKIGSIEETDLDIGLNKTIKYFKSSRTK